MKTTILTKIAKGLILIVLVGDISARYITYKDLLYNLVSQNTNGRRHLGVNDRAAIPPGQNRLFLLPDTPEYQLARRNRRLPDYNEDYAAEGVYNQLVDYDAPLSGQELPDTYGELGPEENAISDNAYGYLQRLKPWFRVKGWNRPKCQDSPVPGCIGPVLENSAVGVLLPKSKNKRKPQCAPYSFC